MLSPLEMVYPWQLLSDALPVDLDSLRELRTSGALPIQAAAADSLPNAEIIADATQLDGVISTVII